MRLKRSLRNFLGWLLAIALIASGSFNKARKKSFQKDVITSVVFHNPGEKLFKNIIGWLIVNGYVFLSTGQLIKILNKEIPCPKGAVWISLDDGWKDNMDNVIPVAVRYNIPITIFLYTDAIERGAFWWQAVARSARLLPAEYRDAGALRLLPDYTRRQIVGSLALSDSKLKREAMSVEDIGRFAATPQLTFGAHTVTHPVLPRCSDSRIEEELRESKMKIEAWTGEPVKAFAYPNGMFDGRERGFLEKCGYELAATTENGSGSPHSNRYYFPRNVVMDDGSIAENLCHVLGLWGPLIRGLKNLFRSR